MIYSPGETVDFLPLTSSHPETAVFHLTDQHGQLVMLPLTVANNGLVQRRKGALHPVFNAPPTPGRYSYRFWDSEQVKSGVIRVTPADPAPHPEPERRARTRW